MILGNSENKENIVAAVCSETKATKFLCKKVNRSPNPRKKLINEEMSNAEGIPGTCQESPKLTSSYGNVLNSIKKKNSCNCKNSQCLKLYCECFASLQHCDPNICSCKGCSNDTQHETLRSEKIQVYLRKNPPAFRNILVSSSNYQLEKKGCTCKKSNCMKKYCECYQNNAKCGNYCKCLDCKNTTEEATSNITSKTSTRTSSISNYDEFKIGKKLVPCMVIINNYKINEEYIIRETEI